MNIKPIETIYNGYRFRSRLEARWAVFFDACNIKYQYEPEGFEVKFANETYRYLPDFYFPDFDMWAEVKPNKEKLLEDKAKIAMCIDYNNTELAFSNGLMILGQIPYYDLNDDQPIPAFNRLWWNEGVLSGLAKFVMGYHGGIVWDNICYDCTSAPDFPDLLSNDDLIYWTKGVWHSDDNGLSWHLDDVSLRNMNAKLLKCYTEARQARFEHGEHGGRR